jgi:hypothetical protein
MSKKKHASTPFEALTSTAGGLPEAGARTRAFWEAQADAVDHVREFTDSWWERRRSAAHDAADCCAKLAEGGADPAAAAEVWTAWSHNALERLSQDAACQVALAGRLVSDAMRVLSADSNEAMKRDAREKANGDAQPRQGSQADVR